MAFRLRQLLALGGSAGAGWGYCRKEAEVAQIHPHEPERFAFTQIHSNSIPQAEERSHPTQLSPSLLSSGACF